METGHRLLLAVALCGAAALSTVGCGKDKVVVGEWRRRPPPPISLPQVTLYNMTLAYVARDSVQTAAVYDDDYRGTTTDATDPIPVRTFTRADEVRHVGALKTNPDVFGILLDLGNPGFWASLPADPPDPPEWRVIRISSWRLLLHTAHGFYEASDHPMTFTFKPVVSAPGDTTWKIVRWTEVVN